MAKKISKKGNELGEKMKNLSPGDYLFALKKTVKNSKRLYEAAKLLESSGDIITGYNLSFLAVEESIKALGISLMYEIVIKAPDNKLPPAVMGVFYYLFESHFEKIEGAKQQFISSVESEIRKHDLLGSAQYLRYLKKLRQELADAFSKFDLYGLKNNSIYVDVDRTKGKFIFPEDIIKLQHLECLLTMYEVLSIDNNNRLRKYELQASKHLKSNGKSNKRTA